MASNFGSNYTFGTNGVIIPDTSDIQTTIQEEFRNALGQDLSLEESTPQGRLIDVETNARSNTIRFNAIVANTIINIAMSSGSALDAWGANYDIPRNGATASTVQVVVTGVANTVIPAGSQASTNSGIIWSAVNEIVIGTLGSAVGTFICSQTGSIEIGVGELTNIIASTTTGIDGWETITNTSVATLGANQESDASYKARILNGLFTGSALFGNYASSVYRVENVQDVYVKENPYGTPLILDNITIPAHSVYVCVQGGNAEDVAYALYEVKSAGAGWVGNTTIVVVDKEYGTNNTVQFNTPTLVPISVEVDATSTLNTNLDLSQTIKETILNYVIGGLADNGYSKIGIRGLISPFTIASVLNSQINGININRVQVALTTAAPHAVADIIKASVTTGLIWASVDTTTFATQITTNGTYNFVYNGTDWQLAETNVTLSDYGIEITTVNNGEPAVNDVVTVIFSTGELSQGVIKLFATEFPTFTAEDITVNINV